MFVLYKNKITICNATFLVELVDTLVLETNVYEHKGSTPLGSTGLFNHDEKFLLYLTSFKLL